MSGTLHITNGDAVAGAIARALPGDDVLPWRDVLHEGPVPDGSDDALREARAAFIAAEGWGDADTIRRDLAERDRTAAQAAKREAVVLWFEPDLYDQLQLIQALDLLVRAGAPLARLTMVAPADYLGPMEPAAARLLLREARQPVTRAQAELAQAAWAAVRASEPTALARLAAANDPALRFLSGSLVRLLEELPAPRRGTSRSERQVLRALADGPRTLGELFLACGEAEEWMFCGDSAFLLQLRRLGAGRAPLLRCDRALDAAIAQVFDDVAAMRALFGARCALTEAGRAVLAGEQDWVALSPIDRWVGGTHLRPGHVWRWDGTQAVRDGA